MHPSVVFGQEEMLAIYPGCIDNFST